jgi:hypothetical protein
VSFYPASPVWQGARGSRGDDRDNSFSGRAGRGGRGGRIDRIVLSRLDGGELVDLGPWTSHDDLCDALAAPTRDRFGSFAGQPRILVADLRGLDRSLLSATTDRYPSTPKAAMLAGIPLHAKRGSLAETAAWATKGQPA